jgi:hypothetical protein
MNSLLVQFEVREVLVPQTVGLITCLIILVLHVGLLHRSLPGLIPPFASTGGRDHLYLTIVAEVPPRPLRRSSEKADV